MATPDGARDALRAVADDLLGRLPMSLTPAAARRLEGLIDRAAEEVVRADARGTPDALETSIRSIRTLIIEAAYRQYPGATRRREGKALGQEYDDVEPDDVDGALRALCPGFWPFC